MLSPRRNLIDNFGLVQRRLGLSKLPKNVMGSFKFLVGYVPIFAKGVKGTTFLAADAIVAQRLERFGQ